MRDPKRDGRRWLDQAENDLAFVRHAIQGSFFHQACFTAQQCAEKAVKAVLFADGAGAVGPSAHQERHPGRHLPDVLHHLVVEGIPRGRPEPGRGWLRQPGGGSQVRRVHVAGPQ